MQMPVAMNISIPCQKPSQRKQIIAIAFASWTMLSHVLRLYQRNQ